MKALRRCAEDRTDFGSRQGDASFWPMRATEGGALFGFCPAKATWYPDVAALYRVLTICAETGALPYEGGLMAQPDWMIALLGWFIPRYKSVQFHSRAESILGKVKPEAKKDGDVSGRPVSPNRR